MDEMGVDMQLICPAPPQIYYYLPLDVGVQAARVLNDGIAEYVGKHKDRLVALGGVPMQDGNEAAKELERGMKQLGFKGVEILTNVNGKELSDPAFAPFWKKAEELDALVLIHPTGFTQPQRFARFYFNNVIGNPLDTTMALHYLIFDGVFERHPKLRVLAVHGGGFLGAYSGRIDHAWGARSDCARRPAEAADDVPQAQRLFRHGRVHAASARSAGEDLRRRPHRAGHRLSLRHAGVRSDRPRRFGRSFDDATRAALAAATRRGCWGCELLPVALKWGARSRVQKIQHRGLRDHRVVGAVPAGARLFFLRCVACR